MIYDMIHLASSSFELLKKVDFTEYQEVTDGPADRWTDPLIERIHLQICKTDNPTSEGIKTLKGLSESWKGLSES